MYFYVCARTVVLFFPDGTRMGRPRGVLQIHSNMDRLTQAYDEVMVVVS